MLKFQFDWRIINNNLFPQSNNNIVCTAIGGQCVYLTCNVHEKDLGAIMVNTSNFPSKYILD